jgi:peptidoglycan/xylan/chitin deacetylase (PgdA/CDA1 family)
VAAPLDAILTFHSIDDSGGLLSYPERELARLLDGLLEEGVAIVPLARLVERPPDARPRVALTFDDGLKTVRSAALPLLKTRSLPFTLFVVTDFVGRDNGWPSQRRGIARRPLLDWSELEELRDAGAEIGSHSASHVALRGLAEAGWTRELADSRKRLEDRLGVAATSFAYPYGIHGDEAERRVAESFARAVTTRLAYVRRGEPPLRMPRLESHYLQPASRWRALFGGRARAGIRWRAVARAIRRRGYGP